MDSARLRRHLIYRRVRGHQGECRASPRPASWWRVLKIALQVVGVTCSGAPETIPRTASLPKKFSWPPAALLSLFRSRHPAPVRGTPGGVGWMRCRSRELRTRQEQTPLTPLTPCEARFQRTRMKRRTRKNPPPRSPRPPRETSSSSFRDPCRSPVVRRGCRGGNGALRALHPARNHARSRGHGARAASHESRKLPFTNNLHFAPQLVHPLPYPPPDSTTNRCWQYPPHSTHTGAHPCATSATARASR